MKNSLLMIALAGMLSACTSEQLYNTSQEYQRNQCRNMPDKTASDNCLDKANTSYEDYKQQTSN